jgi:hypothetical protein
LNYIYDSETTSFEILNSFIKIDQDNNVKIHLLPERIKNKEILYCHEAEKEIYKDLFYTALDRYDLPKKYHEIYDQKKMSIKELHNLKKYLLIHNDSSVHGIHHGWHRQHHWALFFHNLIKDLV